MRLEAKLALFNALSKLLLVLLGAVVIPPIVQRVAVGHTDQHLREKQRRVLALIARDGLQAFERGERAETYADYNIFKQEYITLTPLPAGTFDGDERIVMLTRPAPPGSRVGVTLEANGGADRPTRPLRVVAERAP